MDKIQTYLMQDLMDNTLVSDEVEEEWAGILQGITDQAAEIECQRIAMGWQQETKENQAATIAQLRKEVSYWTAEDRV